VLSCIGGRRIIDRKSNRKACRKSGRIDTFQARLYRSRCDIKAAWRLAGRSSMTKVRDRLESILSRLAARADEERVFSKVYAERARAEADAADARHKTGQPIGPLDGRIVSIKDLFDVAGEPTLAGSVIRRDAAPAIRDAVVVQRLRDAGAVIVG